MGLLRTVAAWAEACPEALSHVYYDAKGVETDRLTFGLLQAQSLAVARWLRRDLGLAVGDRVLLVLPPGLELIPVLLGCWRAGIVAASVVPPAGVDPARELELLKHFVADCGATVALTTASFQRARRWLSVKWLLRHAWPSEVRWEAVDAPLSSAAGSASGSASPSVSDGTDAEFDWGAREDAQRALEAQWDDVASRAGFVPVAAAPFAAAAVATTDANARIDPAAGADATGCVYIQYTSGSTKMPKGVMLQMRHIESNLAAMAEVILVPPSPNTAEEAREHFQERPAGGVSWVGWGPHWHDMPLFGSIMQPLTCGGVGHLISPVSFLRNPLLWFELCTRVRATHTQGASFAYALCTRRYLDLDPSMRPKLDLSTVRMAAIGAEPVDPRDIQAFARTFGPVGWHPEAMFHGYGMAELVLTGHTPGRAFCVLREGSDAASGRVAVVGVHPLIEEGGPRASNASTSAAAAAAVREGSRAVMHAGASLRGTVAVIVDPESREPLPLGVEGEIWIDSPSKCAGYMGRHAETRDVVFAQLADGGCDDVGPALRARRYLRTGDRGFMLPHTEMPFDTERAEQQLGSLFLSGRDKDMITVRGANHYAGDIELAASAARIPALRPGCLAAFADGALFGGNVGGGEQGEVAVVVADVRDTESPQSALCAAAAELRGAVQAACGVTLARIVLVPPRSVPKTTSGKLQRARARQMLHEGRLTVLWDDRVSRGPGGGSALVPVPAAAAGAGPVAVASTAGPQPPSAETVEVVSRIARDLVLGVVAGDEPPEDDDDDDDADDKLEIGLDDDLFELGLSSLSVAALTQRINAELPAARLDASIMYVEVASPTVRAISRVVDDRLRRAAAAAATSLARTAVQTADDVDKKSLTVKKTAPPAIGLLSRLARWWLSIPAEPSVTESRVVVRRPEAHIAATGVGFIGKALTRAAVNAFDQAQRRALGQPHEVLDFCAQMSASVGIESRYLARPEYHGGSLDAAGLTQAVAPVFTPRLASSATESSASAASASAAAAASSAATAPAEGLLPLTGRERMELWWDAAKQLTLLSARAALAEWAATGVEGCNAPEDITHVIVTTASGWREPGIAGHLIEALGLRPDTQKQELHYNGCFCAATCLRLAADIVRAGAEETYDLATGSFATGRPGWLRDGTDSAAAGKRVGRRCVLVVGVEVPSAHRSFDGMVDRDDNIALELFTDGSGAAIVAPTGAWRVANTGSHVAPDTKHVLGLLPHHPTLGDTYSGHKMILTPEAPKAVLNYLGKEGGGASIIERMAAPPAGARNARPAMAVHPGGPRILGSVSQVLRQAGWPDDALRRCTDTFTRRGNLGSTATLVVLHDLLHDPAAVNPFDTIGVLAFGPGLTVEHATLERASSQIDLQHEETSQG